MGDDRIRRRVLVSGRVQGVNFRAGCARAARSAGVGGWVRNRADGRVEAEFEGAPTAVDAMISWCRDGPRWARVEGVEVEDRAPSGETGFRAG